MIRLSVFGEEVNLVSGVPVLKRSYLKSRFVDLVLFR